MERRVERKKKLVAPAVGAIRSWELKWITSPLCMKECQFSRRNHRWRFAILHKKRAVAGREEDSRFLRIRQSTTRQIYNLSTTFPSCKASPLTKVKYRYVKKNTRSIKREHWSCSNGSKLYFRLCFCWSIVAQVFSTFDHKIIWI